LSGPANATVLTSAKATDENTLREPMKVAPVSQKIPTSGNGINHTFPGNSVTVIRVKAI